jgi:uroporphyrinogen decarboxylase
VLGWSDTRPFDHLCSRQGGEAAMVELARNTKAVREQLSAIHDFACKELELWAASEVDGVAIRDDWGTQEGLSGSPEMWREVFRPFYKEYCKILHAKDKFVFFHSHGDTFDLFGDLVKLGVDAIHVSAHLSKIGRLAKKHRGRVTFWCEMDREQLRNPGSLNDFRQDVLAIRKELDFGGGGVIARCPWEQGIRIQTAAAFFEQWLVQLSMRE